MPQLFFLLLALLVPIALYCVALALLNRRAHPVMVPGIWDCAGLLFAGAGLLLVVGPAIITTLETGAIPQMLDVEWRAITIAYYAVVVVGIALVLWLRHDKTVIYNVDADKLATVLAQTLTRLGLTAMRSGRQIIIRQHAPAHIDLPPDAFQAVDSGMVPHQANPYGHPPSSTGHAPAFFAAIVEVEAFAPLANVTLHWRGWDDPQRAALRREIEEDLDRNLTLAARGDNPAVTWLLGIATAIFGLLFLATLLLILFSNRR